MADKLSPDQFRQRLLEALGGPWPTSGSLDAKVSATEVCDGFTREQLSYATEPEDRVPAILLVPDSAAPEHPAPAICVWHQHHDDWQLGKSEPAGLAGNPRQHVGVTLAKRGYVVLCPDALCFEDRQSPDLQGGDFERFVFLQYLVAGKSLAWKAILDMRRAVDYLETRREVDNHRIGCFGHSMGSTFTWLAGPWEPRFKALAGNCCLPTYAGIQRNQLLHCFANFIPGLHPYGDTPDIASLIAPRPLHLNFGELDPGSPIDEVQRGLQTVAQAYEAQKASENFSHFIEPQVGHELTPAMWAKVEHFFAKHLPFS